MFDTSFNFAIKRTERERERERERKAQERTDEVFAEISLKIQGRIGEENVGIGIKFQ